MKFLKINNRFINVNAIAHIEFTNSDDENYGLEAKITMLSTVIKQKGNDSYSCSEIITIYDNDAKLLLDYVDNLP